MIFQGKAANVQLCLLLIIILAPCEFSGAIYLTTNIISSLISSCVFKSTKPLSLCQPHVIVPGIQGGIYEAAALKSNVLFSSKSSKSV